MTPASQLLLPLDPPEERPSFPAPVRAALEHLVAALLLQVVLQTPPSEERHEPRT